MYKIDLQAGQKILVLRVDRLYGASAEDVFESETAVLIGTGIGVSL
jgi:hypothetical protein